MNGDPVVAPSQDERASGGWSGSSTREAIATLAREGCLQVDDVLPVALGHRQARAWAESYGRLTTTELAAGSEEVAHAGTTNQSDRSRTILYLVCGPWFTDTVNHIAQPTLLRRDSTRSPTPSAPLFADLRPESAEDPRHAAGNATVNSP
jgi:hypothetical protein